MQHLVLRLARSTMQRIAVLLSLVVFAVTSNAGYCGVLCEAGRLARGASPHAECLEAEDGSAAATHPIAAAKATKVPCKGQQACHLSAVFAVEEGATHVRPDSTVAGVESRAIDFVSALVSPPDRPPRS